MVVSATGKGRVDSGSVDCVSIDAVLDPEDGRVEAGVPSSNFNGTEDYINRVSPTTCLSLHGLCSGLPRRPSPLDLEGLYVGPGLISVSRLSRCTLPWGGRLSD